MIRNNRMKRFPIVSSAVIVGALLLGVAPATAADPGITAKEIKLGMSSPIQGDAGKVYGKLPGAMKAYFNYINDNGGVYGRKITLIHRDDKYAPTLAAKQTTQLVINDKVFAIVGALGTPTHTLAYGSAQLAAKKIPDLFVNTGFSGFDDLVKYPTAFTVLPSYAMEAKVIAKYIKDTPALASLPSAFIAQDDEFGKDSTKGFTASGYKFAVPFKDTFYPQGGMSLDRAKGALTTLNGLGIKLLVLNTTADVSATILKAAESLKLEKKFTWIIGSVGGDSNTMLFLGVSPATIDGVIAASFFPDAKDSTDPYVKQFMTINSKYNKGITFDNVVLQGMNTAMLTVQALRAAGKNPTRAGLIEAIQTKGSTFASAALLPLNYSKTSHVGYNGYWVGQLNAKGELKPVGGTPTIYTTDSKSGPVVVSSFKRAPLPKNGIPNN